MVATTIGRLVRAPLGFESVTSAVATLAFVGVNPGITIPLVGASGAIAAVMGA